MARRCKYSAPSTSFNPFAARWSAVAQLCGELAGKKVAIVLSGGNVDLPTLRQVVTETL